MPCYTPLRPYIGPVKEPGKTNIVWHRSESWKGESLVIPCGQCIGCRLEYARQWAVRCVKEASLYEDNSFITLTYDYDHMPLYESVELREFQLFMKKLRKEYGEGIRYFHCGEYGRICAGCGQTEEICKSVGCKLWIEKLGRPHYHAILFNHDFKDKVLFQEKKGQRLYISGTLDKLWNKGFATTGDVSFKSASYVARYSMKKLKGKKKVEYGLRKSEYVSMSRGCEKLGTGGIGKGWYDKFKTDVFPSDEMVINGAITKPPKIF